jgi:hypothetical protein
MSYEHRILSISCRWCDVAVEVIVGADTPEDCDAKVADAQAHPPTCGACHGVALPAYLRDLALLAGGGGARPHRSRESIAATALLAEQLDTLRAQDAGRSRRVARQLADLWEEDGGTCPSWFAFWCWEDGALKQQWGPPTKAAS